MSLILDINGISIAYNIYRFEIDALNVVLKKAAVPMGDKPANSWSKVAWIPDVGRTLSSLVSTLNLWIKDDFKVCPHISRASKWRCVDPETHPNKYLYCI